MAQPSNRILSANVLALLALKANQVCRLAVKQKGILWLRRLI